MLEGSLEWRSSESPEVDISVVDDASGRKLNQFEPLANLAETEARRAPCLKNAGC